MFCIQRMAWFDSGYENADFSGSSLPELFPHAALIGSIVDTCMTSVHEFLFALGTRILFLRLLVAGSAM